MEESNLPEATSGGDIASQPTQADADEASKKRKRDEPEAGTNTRQNDEDDEPPLVVSAKKPKNFDETPTVATVEPTEPKVEMQPEPPAPKKKEKPGIDEEGKKKVRYTPNNIFSQHIFTSVWRIKMYFGRPFHPARLSRSV